MRKSSISSSIPVKNDIKRRSKSAMRPSKDFTSSGGTKLKGPGGGLKRSNSFQSMNSLKRTPSFSSTPQTNRLTKSPFKLGSAKRERPVGDKKWVAEQFAKVKNFLLYINCNEALLNNLKPPTIATFVEVIRILFNQLDIHLEINTTNYKEIIISKMKSLRYPGVISMSLLKTVNTMYNWPQIISMWSWLVDLIHAIKPPEETVGNNSSCDIVLGYLADRYYLYNSQNNREEEELLTKEFVQKLNEIYNVNEEANMKLSKEIKDLQQEYENTSKQVEIQENEITKMREDIQHLESKVIELYLKKKHIDIDLLPFKYKNHEDTNMHIDERISAVNHNIEQLKSIVENQICSASEKNELVNDINEMKHTKNLKQEQLEKRRQIKDAYDYKLLELKKEIENKVYSLNTSLMEPMLFYPELKVLKLRDSGFLSEDFIDEIKKSGAARKEIESKMKRQLEELKESRKKLTEEIMECECKNKKYQIEIAQLNEEINSLNNKMKSCEDAQKTEIEYLEAEKMNISKEIEKLERFDDDLIKYKLEMEKALIRKFELEKTIRENATKCLIFMKNVHDLHSKVLREMNHIRINLLAETEETFKTLLSSFEEIEKTVKKLDVIKK